MLYVLYVYYVYIYTYVKMQTKEKNRKKLKYVAKTRVLRARSIYIFFFCNQV